MCGDAVKFFDPLGFGEKIADVFKGPEPPKVPKAPVVDPEEERKRAAAAALRRAQKAKGAFGFPDTNITLGQLGPAQTQTKTLLGS
jgi:hypothetical protein